MGRKFAPSTPEQLSQKMASAMEEDGFYGLVDTVKPDLKVHFDLENYEYKESSSPAVYGPKGLMGIKTINGLTFCGCIAGGDWESPVFFIVYLDGKKLRAYVPKEGNPWNTTTKSAYGNDEESDLKNAKKRYPDLYDDSDEEDLEFYNIPFDEVAIQKDIFSRLTPV